MRKKFPTRTGTKPANFYRSVVSSDDLRRAMSGKGLMTLTQVVGCVTHIIPPEAKMRHWMTDHLANRHRTLAEKLAAGERRVVRLRLFNLMHQGKVEKHGSGIDAKYRWKEAEEASSCKDSA